MARIVACHQPNFLPWLGFFDKIDRADVFVVLDRVQLIRHSFTTRTTLLQGGRPLQLSLPIAHTGTQDLPIGDARLSEDARPFRKMAAALRQSYRRAPFWERFGEPIAQAIDAPTPRLVDMNLGLLRPMMLALGLDPAKLVLQSGLPFIGNKSELMASLTRAAGGDVYLSGGHDPGDAPRAERSGTAADYNDAAVYHAQGVRLVYQGFVHPTYDQGGVFVPGISALDALLRLGPEALRETRRANGRL